MNNISAKWAHWEEVALREKALLAEKAVVAFVYSGKGNPHNNSACATICLIDRQYGSGTWIQSIRQIQVNEEKNF
jgi:hypothetical protein